jgi:hypothetical protein
MCTVVTCAQTAKTMKVREYEVGMRSCAHSHSHSTLNLTLTLTLTLLSLSLEPPKRCDRKTDILPIDVSFLFR